MKNINKAKIASYINLMIFIMVAFAGLGMIFGFLIKDDSVLSDNRIEALKYFTVDSNILMGVVAIVAFFKEKNGDAISRKLATWLLVGTVGVTLTMIVTVGFLTSIVEEPGELFTGSNFFFHLIVPIVSIINFTVFERTDKLKVKDTIFGIVPVIIYGSIYVGNILIHLKDGGEIFEYDWYGFMTLGEKMLVIGLPVMLIFTWLISFALYKGGRIKY